MRLHWVNALGLSLHPKSKILTSMQGMFFTFILIIAVANLAGAYVESMSNNSNLKSKI